MIPAMGGFMPIFTLLLAYFIIDQKNLFGWQDILSFLLLTLGSIIVSWENSFKFSVKSLTLAGVSAFLLSLYFVLSKVLYSSLGFWPAFIWIRIAYFIFALFLIFFKDVREELFKRKKSFTPKTSVLFIVTQITGGGAVILQNWAIALASSFYISFISALQGVQYTFLFLLTYFISLKSPRILKERISKKILTQKILAIALVISGLIILVV